MLRSIIVLKYNHSLTFLKMRFFPHVSSPKHYNFTVKKRGISKFCFFKDNLLLNEEVTKQNGMGQVSKINLKNSFCQIPCWIF